MPAYASLDFLVTKSKTQVASRQRAPKAKFRFGEVLV
jgi:hypothetical protein